MKFCNIFTLFMIATCSASDAQNKLLPNENNLLPTNYKREWSKSSIPIVFTVCIIGAIASAAAALLPTPKLAPLFISRLEGQPFFMLKIIACYRSAIFILSAFVSSLALYCKESYEDQIYYMKKHRDEVINKLQQCPEPEKINYRSLQRRMIVISLLSALLPFAIIYGRGIYRGMSQPNFNN